MKVKASKNVGTSKIEHEEIVYNRIKQILGKRFLRKTIKTWAWVRTLGGSFYSAGKKINDWDQ